MFVEIDDYKGAIAVENILTPYKKGRLSEDKKNTFAERTYYAGCLYGGA